MADAVADIDEEMGADEDEEMDLSCRPVGALKATELEYSTVTADTREGGSNKKRQCILCDHQYNGGPAHVRFHLVPGGIRQVKLCKPTSGWVQRYKEVLAALKLRVAAGAAVEAEQARIDAARTKARQAGTTGAGVEARPAPMFKIPTAEDCNDQWCHGPGGPRRRRAWNPVVSRYPTRDPT
ncbi:hypothetical protein M885DRAFT_532646 [Pelagophyceae sp. CCMP2097]|nr:hypothetical protein M885DRAFT_532646 [Pelagophyceae sp. CCMP2097]